MNLLSGSGKQKINPALRAFLKMLLRETKGKN